MAGNMLIYTLQLMTGRYLLNDAKGDGKHHSSESSYDSPYCSSRDKIEGLLRTSSFDGQNVS